MTVPLAAFDIETEKLNPGNIKQLMLELQQSGDIYLDDIRLVFYQQPDEPAWLEELAQPEPIDLPLLLFDEDFINRNGWGLMKDECRDIRLSSEKVSKGQKALLLSWDESQDCGPLQLGVSWNKWFPVDMRSNGHSTELSLQLFNESPESKGRLLFQLQDYSGATSKAYTIEVSDLPLSWHAVRIPLSSLLEGIDISNIKQLQISLEEAGRLYLDQLVLQEIPRS